MDVRGGFFTQLLFHDPISFNLACDLVLYITFFFIWLVSFSRYVNKPSACLAASRTQGLCAFLWDFMRFRGELEVL